MVEVLYSGYIVPFCHLFPVPQEPLKFPSCALGSAKADAIQEEVDRMLQKGILELVDHPGLAYYSRQFLVQKVLHDQLVESEWIHYLY